MELTGQQAALINATLHDGSVAAARRAEPASGVTPTHASREDQQRRHADEVLVGELMRDDADEALTYTASGGFESSPQAPGAYAFPAAQAHDISPAALFSETERAGRQFELAISASANYIDVYA